MPFTRVCESGGRGADLLSSASLSPSYTRIWHWVGARCFQTGFAPCSLCTRSDFVARPIQTSPPKPYHSITTSATDCYGHQSLAAYQNGVATKLKLSCWVRMHHAWVWVQRPRVSLRVLLPNPPPPFFVAYQKRVKTRLTAHAQHGRGPSCSFRGSSS